jgi:hypothetical protein
MRDIQDLVNATAMPLCITLYHAYTDALIQYVHGRLAEAFAIAR